MRTGDGVLSGAGGGVHGLFRRVKAALLSLGAIIVLVAGSVLAAPAASAKEDVGGAGELTLQLNLGGGAINDDRVQETASVHLSWCDGLETEEGNCANWPDEKGITIEVPVNGGPVTVDADIPAGTHVWVDWGLPAELDWEKSFDISLVGVTVSGVDIDQSVPNYNCWSEVPGECDFDGRYFPFIMPSEGADVVIDGQLEYPSSMFNVTKKVSGEAAALVDDDAEFTVTASWVDESGAAQSTDAVVSQSQSVTVIPGVPEGVDVTFTETSKPVIDGVEWGAALWTAAQLQCPSPPAAAARGGEVSDLAADSSTPGDIVQGRDSITLTTGYIAEDFYFGACAWQVQVVNQALAAPESGFGGVGVEKVISSGEGDPVSVESAVEQGLVPEDVAFDVQVDSIDLPEGAEPADGFDVEVGDKLTLDESNDWSWESGDVLPEGTEVSFSEVTPEPVAGVDWAAPKLDKDSVTVETGETAMVEVVNTIVPTTEVDIEKTVSGSLAGQLAEKSAFEVTASWTDADGVDRACVFTVKNGESAVPTEDCDATVIDGKVYFPQGTEITFEETGASEDARHMTWKDVKWTVEAGDADLDSESKGDRFPTIATVVIEGESAVTIGLENVSGPDGLIIIPIIPIFPVVPGAPVPPVTPEVPGGSVPGTPGESVPGTPVSSVPGTPGESSAQKPSSGSSGGGLANTGASVIGLAALALLLAGGGAWLVLRNRREGEA